MADEHDNDMPEGVSWSPDDLRRFLEGLVGGVTGKGAHKDATEDTGPSALVDGILDLGLLSRSLLSAADPAARLRAFVGDVRDSKTSDARARHLAQRLVEAGLMEDDPELPPLKVVRPGTSGLFYLRTQAAELSYLAKMRVLAIEGALNGALLADGVLGEPADATEETLVRVEARVMGSVAAQAAGVVPTSGDRSHELSGMGGEWDVRHAICLGLECFRLPWRLTARVRCNVRRHLAAIEVDLTPPRLMPQTQWVADLGIIAATADMRRRAATDYNLRVLVLCAAHALKTCPQLDEIWVAGVEDSPAGHSCLCSAVVTRATLEGVNLWTFDPVELLQGAGAQIDACEGRLSPVRQGFSLDDPRLCPAARYDAPELSERMLPPRAAGALGTHWVCGLGLDPAVSLTRFASEASRHIGDSTEANVHALLDLSKQVDDPVVQAAAKRCVGKLIDGTLEDDPMAVEEEIVAGDELSRAVICARDLATRGSHDEACAILEAALAPIEAAGSYNDTPTESWRAFATYSDRVLYDRMVAPEGTATHVRLVPEAYLDAHVLYSAIAVAQGRVADALDHARRAARLAPLSTPVSLQLAHCLDLAGENDAAMGEMRRLLMVAHDPETIGLAYLRMAAYQWRDGNIRAAQACYQRATDHVPAPIIMLGMQMAAALGAGAGQLTGRMSADNARRALVEKSIPLAPDPEVVELLAEASKAAVDEEIFPVARDLVHDLCSLTRDDIHHAILRSLEQAPDR